MERRPKRKSSATPEPVRRRIAALEKRMLAFARQFCSIATVNPPGDHYTECVEFLADKFRGMGLETRIVQPSQAAQRKVLPGHEAWPRPSVIGRWDVGAKKTLHFTGHYDVVPGTAGWKSNPFKPRVRGRRLIGRGTDDMKCSNTCAIFAVQAIKEAGVRPPWNLELSFTPDEETGGELGLGWLVKSGKIKPDAAVLVEGGSGPDLGYAHKGVLWLDVTVIGVPGHACNPRGGVNALEMACRLIRELKTLERVYARRPTSFRVNRAALQRPTIMIGGIAGGGGKINTIPDRFHFTIDRRVSPEEKGSEVKAEIMAVIRRAERRNPRLQVDVKPLLFVPPGWTDLDDPFVNLAAAAFRAVRGRAPRFRMTPGFTDLHWLTQDLRIPGLMYGTTGAGAHSDFEYTEIPSMAPTARFYAELALRMPGD